MADASEASISSKLAAELVRGDADDDQRPTVFPYVSRYGGPGQEQTVDPTFISSIIMGGMGLYMKFKLLIWLGILGAFTSMLNAKNMQASDTANLTWAFLVSMGYYTFVMEI